MFWFPTNWLFQQVPVLTKLWSAWWCRQGSTGDAVGMGCGQRSGPHAACPKVRHKHSSSRGWFLAISHLFWERMKVLLLFLEGFYVPRLWACRVSLLSCPAVMLPSVRICPLASWASFFMYLFIFYCCSLSGVVLRTIFICRHYFGICQTVGISFTSLQVQLSRIVA